MTMNEELYAERVAELDAALQATRAKLVHARETVGLLEDVVHKAAKIAGHLPYLCQTLVEGSPELEQAALQLEQILVHRKV